MRKFNKQIRGIQFTKKRFILDSLSTSGYHVKLLIAKGYEGHEIHCLCEYLLLIGNTALPGNENVFIQSYCKEHYHSSVEFSILKI